MSGTSNTSAKLGHATAGQSQSSNQAPAQSYGGAADGNTSGAAGASNPAAGGGKIIPDGPAQEIAGTLPQNFNLGGMKADPKGGENVVANPIQGESLSTYGHGGDTKHAPLQSHETSIPDSTILGRPRENIGENQKP